MAARVVDDYYAILGVAEDADEEELRRVWRKLALEYHPDRAGEAATAEFQRLSVAYAVLSDPAARAAYDLQQWGRARRGHGRTKAPTPAPAPEPPPRRAPGVMLQRLSGPLNALVARGVVREADDGVLELYLEPDEIAEGGMITISMWVPIRCPSCAADPTVPCPRCRDQRTIDDLFSAWLAVRPDAAEGTILTPSAKLPGMIRDVQFRVRRAAT